MKIKKVVFLLIISISVQSCVLIKELIPKQPSESFNVDEINNIKKSDLAKSEDISMEPFYVKGFDEKHTPPNIEPTKKLKNFLIETQGIVDLNRSTVFKYFNKSNKKISKIIIMVPGIYSGAGTLANLSFSMARRIPESEIWVWERRANQLEDRRIILKALDENNPKMLTDILKDKSFELKNKEKNFYQPSTEDISFAGYWGLNVLLYDLYNVVKEARNKADEVILAGYSLGVLYSTMFLANNFFDNGETIPGYKLVDKVMLLDGPPMIDNYITSEKMYDEGATIIPYNIIEGKDKLESGKYYPCNASVKRDFSMFFIMDLQAALAQLAPYELSNEPYNTGFKKIPIDNLSKYLVQFDDNYNFFKLFTATFGRANAKHSGKFSYTTTVQIIGLSDGQDHISWIPRDRNDKIEFNNYLEYLKAANNKYFNMAEWYQPTRLLLDIGTIEHNDTSKGWQKKYFSLTENKNITMPFFCIGLSRGLIPDIKSYLDYKALINSKNFNIIMINSITHLDGDTIDDVDSRPVIADAASNWINNKSFVNIKSPNYYKAYYKN